MQPYRSPDVLGDGVEGELLGGLVLVPGSVLLGGLDLVPGSVLLGDLLSRQLLFMVVGGS